ncbi:hypothetical protein EZS27_044557, partial [termite gut metagenome]
KSTLIRYESDVTEEELLCKVEELNRDADIDGFIVQLPLPKHIAEQKVIEAIDYRKDVDGFHPINAGRMSIGLPCFVAATPAGILELLKGEGKSTEINVAETPKDVRIALLDADVNYKVAKSFTETVKEKALGQSVLTAVKPGELLVKIVHDELTTLMGGDTAEIDL